MRDNIIKAYLEIDEENRLSSTLARRVEFLTTIDVLEHYINLGKKIIDVGCGVGVYSSFYAKMGVDVTALDIVPQHIEKLKKIANDEHFDIKAVVGDATNLECFESDSFDVVMCMGPLYHMIDYNERVACISESKRIAKKDGIVIFSYISPLSVLPCVVRGDTTRLSKELIEKIVDEHMVSSNDDCCFWTDCYYYSPKQIENELKNMGFEIIDHVATDGQSIAFQSMVNSLDESQFELWLSYHQKVCREPSIIGVSNHGLIVAKKA